MKQNEVQTGSLLKRLFDAHADKLPRSRSLRSTAKLLGLSAPYLSQLLNGQRRLTVQTASKIANKLSVSSSEHEMLMLLVERESADDAIYRKQLDSRLSQQSNDFVEKDAEVFRVMREWYHIPILEMTFLLDFELTASSVAKRLGITLLEATVAIARLERLGMLEKDANGRYVKVESRCVFRTSRQDEAFSNFLHQMSDLGRDSIDRPPLNERIASTYTIPMDRESLLEVRKLAREFIGKVISLSDKFPQATDVYQVNLQCFNLTDSRPKGRQKIARNKLEFGD